MSVNMTDIFLFSILKPSPPPYFLFHLSIFFFLKHPLGCFTPLYAIAGRDESVGLLDGKRPISGDNWMVIIPHIPHVYLGDGNEKLCIVA